MTLGSPLFEHCTSAGHQRQSRFRLPIHILAHKQQRVIAILEPRRNLIIVVLAATGWLTSARLMRGMVLSLRDQTFTEAAKAMGASNARIIFTHMIPNSMAPIIVDATLALAGFIILEAALSFLGFGIQPPIPTWGNMLAEYQGDMWTQPAKVFYPGLSIFVVNLAFNYMGDAMRDALDPRLKR